MIKKTLKFEDYNGVETTGDFYFHLNEAELTEMELTQPGGIAAYFKKIVDEQDGAKIVDAFKNLVLSSYGVRSLDGLRFEKSREIRDAFEQHPAYPALFMELVTDAKSASEFVNGLIPKSLLHKVQAAEPVVPGHQKPAVVIQSQLEDRGLTGLDNLSRAELEARLALLNQQA